MGAPQTISEVRTDDGTVPANTNTLSVVNAADQMAGAAVEAVKRADEKVELTEAPAIIVRRSIGEAIERGDIRFGQKVPGKDIILATVYEPTNRRGESLGRPLAFFGAPENLPGDPRTFNQNVTKIGDLQAWHGFNGWNFNPQSSGTSSYEDARFKGYQKGDAIGKWGVPELPILNGNDRNGKTVDSTRNMLALSNNDSSDFHNTFVTIPGSFGAKWSQTCTEDPDSPDYVHTVHFQNGNVIWDLKVDFSSCVRPVVALELRHCMP